MRLGIFGASFNPIHLGHLLLAEAAREQHRLDEIWFMPSCLPPHKSAAQMAAGVHRLAMIRLAVRGHAAFRASDLELRLGGTSYTVRTMRAIRERHPRAALFFLAGADVLRVRWYRFEELRRLCTFLVAARSGTRASRLPAGMRPIVMPTVDISSSLIRERVRRGRSIRYLVPPAVEAYIRRHRLYR